MRRKGLVVCHWILYISASGIYAQSSLVNENTTISYLVKKAELSNWKVAKKTKGISISYRWLNFGDTIKTREVNSSFTTEACVEDILVNLRSKNALQKWNSGVRELNLLSNHDSTWITHIIYDIPYPLSQQDLVTKNTILQQDNNVIIRVNALPNYIEPIEDVNRQHYYVAEWILKPLNRNKTEVLFSAVSFSKSIVPRFIKDPIIQQKLINSFLKLRELSTNHVRIVRL